MALIPEVVGSPTGAAPAPRAAANGDTIAVGDDVQLVIINASGVSVTATVTAVLRCSQGVLHDMAVVVPAGTTRMAGPINRQYANAVSGLAVVNYSPSTTSVTVYTTRV